ncbi:MAG: hypothetical protein GXO98_00485 [Nitrospirae bacterium]|nr:hypothetical protein [Nitrospirota bacterium]
MRIVRVERKREFRKYFQKRGFCRKMFLWLARPRNSGRVKRFPLGKLLSKEARRGNHLKSRKAIRAGTRKIQYHACLFRRG